MAKSDHMHSSCMDDTRSLGYDSILRRVYHATNDKHVVDDNVLDDDVVCSVVEFNMDCHDRECHPIALDDTICHPEEVS